MIGNNGKKKNKVAKVKNVPREKFLSEALNIYAAPGATEKRTVDGSQWDYAIISVYFDGADMLIEGETIPDSVLEMLSKNEVTNNASL